ncbi:MAG: cyclopropane-fatty-acyl-phospholipid synthase family protein [Acidimicrobiia bacterium]|nr:cyclopropane-fatty-acyl-phospholipid synthase family protein [Acidimicrobiia bacterium]
MKLFDTIGTLPGRLVYGALLRLARHGTFELTLSGATKLRRVAGEGPLVSISILQPWRTLLDVIRGGGVGFAEAHIAGRWDTKDLALTLEELGRNLDAYARFRPPGSFMRIARRGWARLTSFRRSQIPTIGDHYNLGNDFYAAWLDSSMTYSSAIYESGVDDLAVAQQAKYRRLAELADIQPGDDVLEIGCGWGGFAEYAASEIGARVTGLTLSTEQAAFARDRLQRAGLADQTEIKIQDFRDETGEYDKIVSIEMIESIPADLWPALFDQIRDRLRSGGRVAMQAITIDDRLYESLLERDDYISKHIFPGGALPSVPAVERLSEERGLLVKSVTDFGSSYARTLRTWLESFDEVWPQLEKQGLDERFRRAWRYYLAYCEAGFTIGRISVHQFELVK